jgi:hypothetical protein
MNFVNLKSILIHFINLNKEENEYDENLVKSILAEEVLKSLINSD